MGIHYKYIICDDHLGLLDGRNESEEARFIYEVLLKNGDTVEEAPEYHASVRGIVFELRKCSIFSGHPLWDRYEQILERDDAGGNWRVLKG